MATMLFLNSKMAMLALIFAVVLVFTAAATTSHEHHKNETSGSPNGHHHHHHRHHHHKEKKSGDHKHHNKNITRVDDHNDVLSGSMSPIGAPRLAPSLVDQEDNYIGYDPIRRGGVPCNGENAKNCSPARNENPWGRGCNPITRCRGCCRRMMLEDQLPLPAAPGTEQFEKIKDYLNQKFFG